MFSNIWQNRQRILRHGIEKILDVLVNIRQKRYRVLINMVLKDYLMF